MSCARTRTWARDLRSRPAADDTLLALEHPAAAITRARLVQRCQSLIDGMKLRLIAISAAGGVEDAHVRAPVRKRFDLRL
jgi:hypothetical protein